MRVCESHARCMSAVVLVYFLIKSLILAVQFSSETTRLSCCKRNASRTGYKVSKRYGRDCWNRWVFRRFLKSSRDDAAITSVGRLFHKREAATPKARSPAVVRREQCRISLCDEVQTQDVVVCRHQLPAADRLTDR